MKIFLDDTKLCPKGWNWVKTIDEFKNTIEKNINDLEAISLDYELKAADKKGNGIDACKYLIENDIFCPIIIIHSTHPKADYMQKILSEYMKNSVIIMEEYDIYKIIEGYNN